MPTQSQPMRQAPLENDTCASMRQAQINLLVCASHIPWCMLSHMNAQANLRTLVVLKTRGFLSHSILFSILYLK